MGKREKCFYRIPPVPCGFITVYMCVYAVVVGGVYIKSWLVKHKNNCLTFGL